MNTTIENTINHCRLSDNEKVNDLHTTVGRLVAHFKIKPTYLTANHIYIVLKNNGFRNIPRVEYTHDNFIDTNNVNKYCSSIISLLDTKMVIDEGRRKTYKGSFIFGESSMLPQNVYFSEKNDDDKIEDNYLDDDDITSLSESEKSVNSEVGEKEEEGYEVYDNDSDQFSE